MVKIFVGNLNTKTRGADLKKKFEKYGEHMERESEAKEAIKALHNAELDGVKINVEMSHGKRDRIGGPLRRRDEGRSYGGSGPRSSRNYPERYGPPPRGYIGGPGGPGGYPPPRGDRYDGPGGWDGPYTPPPPRPIDRGYGYPEDRYAPEPMRREPRGPPVRDIPPEPSYRGPREPVPVRDAPRDAVAREPIPPPSRDYRPSDAPPPQRRYEGYDSYTNGYERYRDSAPGAPGAPPSRPNDYYESYGSYTSGPAGAPSSYDYPDYRDSRPAASSQPPSSYDNNYDYGSYYDYGRENRAAPAPVRQPYGYGR